jgi:hypothetical protein
MPGEQIDRASLAVLAVRHFRGNPPAGRPQQCSSHASDGGMALVEEPVERGTAPADRQTQAGAQCVRHASHRPERDSGDVASLELRDQLLAHAGPTRKVDLPPPGSQAERTDGLADVRVRHTANLGGWTARRRTRDSTPAYPERTDP